MDRELGGIYFDGRTSRAHRVTLAVRDGTVHLAGDVERSTPLEEMRVAERIARAPRKLTFPDEATFEADDQEALDVLLRATGHRDSTVVRAQQSWRGALAALCVTAGVLVLGYLFVLPASADLVARNLPVSVERQMGQGTLALLDRHVFAPSRLPEARREALAARFARLVPPDTVGAMPDGPAPQWQLVFRKSRIGPNAFALPSGHIVMTDEMVELLDDDGAVMATLAHELGHLHGRHLTRRLVQGSIVAAATLVLYGDASSLVAGLPALALDLRHSREAEGEADDYAVALLQRNGLPLAHLERVFAALHGLEKGMKVPAYLASHPATAERLAKVARLRRHGE
ncbi:M48 family metallopeptidase [Pseudoduganella umbonata]|uniref:M48 family metallopeptidase n=1 Tax=Pseudoduganella umbonata TaxID=864828 RepID=A0A4P8HQ22_9BURK|nr:M48 family metallopeptidase [Pseudoduganella umbonata]MBB3220677.1 Zn-dependent protease with chaperone function [Pseudoduganella umbonata]QCP11839.1 M48 family metallopeptidase [Pseudoduganella umbonata]